MKITFPYKRSLVCEHLLNLYLHRPQEHQLEDSEMKIYIKYRNSSPLGNREKLTNIQPNRVEENNTL